MPRELLRGLKCGESGVLDSENDTRMRSPDRCLRIDAATVDCVRPAACITSASAKIAFMSTLQVVSVRLGTSLEGCSEISLRSRRLSLPRARLRYMPQLVS
jgi:hypothetical protein